MPTDFKGFKQGGNTIPVNDTTARNGVIANTKLIKDTVGWSGKNKWDKSKTTGIDATITQTSDGFRAQVSNHTWGSARCDFPTPEKNKDFILSCKANVATAGNFMKMQVYGSTDGSDYSNSIAVTDTYSETKELELAFNSGNYNYLRITLYLTNGTATSADVTFEKPMLRDADILDDTYEPYFGSTAVDWESYAETGVHNRVPYPFSTGKTSSSNGVTFTEDSGIVDVDTDGLTPTGNAFYYICYRLKSNKYAGMKLTGCPANGGNSSYQICCRVGKQSDDSFVRESIDNGEGCVVPSLDESTEQLSIYIRIASTCPILDHKQFKVLLRDASNTVTDFTPPAMTNKELTEKKVDKGFIQLTSSDDLNNLNENGKRYYWDNATPINYAGDKYCKMFVFTVGDFCHQVIIRSNNQIFMRQFNGTAWQSWYKFEGVIVS